MPTTLAAIDPHEHISIYNQPDCILPKSFFEGRFIPSFHPESIDYEQWWEEQITRCEKGWTDGGHTVPPAYYYHLNFKKINMLDMKTDATVIAHPYYSYEDQQLFQDFYNCRKEQTGIFLVTGRGFGKSFSAASIVEHEFTFKDVSECIVSASADPFVKLLWEKIEAGLNSQPEEIRRSKLSDTGDLKQSGYEERDPITNRFATFDDTSFIRKAVYDSNPERTRGTRPNLHIFEEVGSWTGAASLIDCYKKTEPSWWRGSKKTTIPIFIGTGGAMDTGGSIDAKIIFNDPETYGLKAFEYKERKIGKFYPAYSKFTGFYETSGVSDDMGAKAWLDSRRERKKGNPDLFRQETSEFPYDPDEAFQTPGSGTFPIDLLEKQYVRIERDKNLKGMLQKGHLDFVRSGNKITGVRWRQAKDDEEAVFEIIEHPEWTRKDWQAGIIKNLYVGGCDSFDSVAESAAEVRANSKNKKEKRSRGSLYIFKRLFNASTTSRVFVAKIVQRTDDATEFYWNCIKLLMYYNSKALVEYTKIGILQHFITQGFEYMLYKRPRLDATVVKQSVSTNTYGISMPSQVKGHIIRLLKRYVTEEGLVDQIFFQSLLREMMSFSFEGYDKNQFDEVMSAAICLLADDDMYKSAATQQNASTVHFPKFQRDVYGNLVFN